MAKWSRESITFLDTRVTWEGNHLITDLYTKPMDTHQYIHRHSCHPPNCKASIAYSQALRIHRICSKENDYERLVGELKTYLVARGYNEAEVTRQIRKATGQDRKDLLIPKIKTKEQVTPLVLTFHPDLPHLTHILHTNQCVINTSPWLRGALPEPPLVAYRRPLNILGIFLVRVAHGQKKETYKATASATNHAVRRVRI